MTDLPEPQIPTPDQLQRLLKLQEAELRELKERVRLQDEMIDALATGFAKLCENIPGDAKIAARIRDLLFDRKKLIDRASPL